MKLLLDTHIWLWSVLEPHRLSPPVAGELTNPEHQLWLSAVSVWELQMLVHKKRVQLHEEIGTWVAKTLNMLQLNEAPLTIEVALAIPAVSLGHGDPAGDQPLRLHVGAARHVLARVAVGCRLADSPLAYPGPGGP